MNTAGRSAECNSAIQQIENLRYDLTWGLLATDLHLEVLELRLGGEGDALEGQGQEDEIASFEEEGVVGPLEFEPAFDDGQDVGGGNAEMEALAAFDFAGIDAKERVVDQEADADGGVAGIFSLDGRGFEVGEVDAGQ